MFIAHFFMCSSVGENLRGFYILATVKLLCNKHGCASISVLRFLRVYLGVVELGHVIVLLLFLFRRFHMLPIGAALVCIIGSRE